MPAKQPGKQLKWVEIDDFTPGIISQSQSTSAGDGSTTIGITGPVPGSKVGQADGSATYGCIALPNGGLAPLPEVTSVLAPYNTIGVPGDPGSAAVVNIIAGLFVTGPVQNSAGTSGVQPTGDSVIIGIKTYTASGNQSYFLMYDVGYIGDAVAYHNSLASLGPSSGFTGWTTMTGAESTVLQGGSFSPVWFLSYWMEEVSAGNANWLGTPIQWLYPNPFGLSSTAYTYNTPSTGSPGYALAHEGRLVLLAKTSWGWNTSYFSLVNELFNYTDPPQSTTMGTQQETFVPENPTSICAWGSISASELFCVKANGGGFVLQGDLNTPTVTNLPGVQPTYSLVSRTAKSPIGLVYLSRDGGAWVWNGGSTAQKISHVIDDNFYEVEWNHNGGTTGGNTFSTQIKDGWQADVCIWRDWIVFSNDWLFDTQTNSWWKMTPSPTSGIGAHVWYGTSHDGDILYAAPGQGTNACMVETYQQSKPGNQFVWTSFPIRPPTDDKNRSLSVQEVVIRAQGSGTVAVAILGSQGSSTSPGSISPSPTLTFETSADNSQPSMQRVTAGLNAQDLRLSITSTGQSASTPAPIVYSIAIGYTDDAALVSPG